MKIALCGSMTFAKQMLEIKHLLEKKGHHVQVPVGAEKYAKEAVKVEDKWKKIEHDLFRNWYKIIGSSDAVLILNYSKHSIENYVGGNSLIEMAFAHVQHKKIFLLNPVPEMAYSDEIRAMEPIVLKSNFDKIQ